MQKNRDLKNAVELNATELDVLLHSEVLIMQFGNRVLELHTTDYRTGKQCYEHTQALSKDYRAVAFVTNSEEYDFAVVDLSDASIKNTIVNFNTRRIIPDQVFPAFFSKDSA